MKYLIVVFTALLMTACASMDKAVGLGATMPDQEARTGMANNMKDLNASQRAFFIAGKPWIGMSQDQLEALMGGKAEKTQAKLTEQGNQEIQLFSVRVGNWKTGIQSKFYRATLTEGKLSAFQELDRYVGSLDNL